MSLGLGEDVRSIPNPLIDLHIKHEPPTRPRKVCCGGWWWWLKGILEFCFDPNPGLRLEAGTKLNNKNCIII